MYREPKPSTIRCIGYALLCLSFLYYVLEPMVRRVEYQFFGIEDIQNSTIHFLSMVNYLMLLIGTTLMNYHRNNKASLVAMALTFILGVIYPLHGLYSLLHDNITYISFIYNLYAVAVLFGIAFSMFNEKKVYKILPLFMFVIWFFFLNYIVMSRLYFFIGIATGLTYLVSLFMTFYYAAEFVLEKSSQAS